MYVKKFSGDTLDETLKSVKRELGPDAIILKTLTNKGTLGKLKKKRIEITAAISEKEYAKKMKVDSVMSDEDKEKFYSADSQHISGSIQNYHQKDRGRTYNEFGGQSQLSQPLGGKNHLSRPLANAGLMKESLAKFLEEDREEEYQPVGQRGNIQKK